MKTQLMLLAALIAGILLFLPAAPAEAQTACYQPARLAAGTNGRVTTDTSLPNRLRSDPSFRNNVIGTIPAGAVFYVLEGPRCAEGLNWWRVLYDGVTGWTAEGNGWSQYWLEPAAYQPPPTSPACSLPPRLAIGTQARVTPGPSNVVRTHPGTQQSGAWYSEVIGEIPGGGVFIVLNGPECGPDGRLWWYVDYNGLVGWTAEGEPPNEYWLEPYTPVSAPHCPGFMPSRLQPGGFGAVTTRPNLPNRVRAQPGIGTPIVGRIPPGGVFQVLAGPVCLDGTAWWQVAYQGITGWTVEGFGSLYWLEPR